MVSSAQLARFVTAVDQAGAKLVLVGDPEQLQPINAGAAFRAIADRVGFIELEGRAPAGGGLAAAGIGGFWPQPDGARTGRLCRSWRGAVRGRSRSGPRGDRAGRGGGHGGEPGEQPASCWRIGASMCGR